MRTGSKETRSGAVGTERPVLDLRFVKGIVDLATHWNPFSEAEKPRDDLPFSRLEESRSDGGD